MGLGGGSKGYDYGAAQRAAEAEAAKLAAEKALEERKAELQQMADKQTAAEQEAKAKEERRRLLSKSAYGDDIDDEEDVLNPTSRKDPKNTQSILKAAE